MAEVGLRGTQISIIFRIRGQGRYLDLDHFSRLRGPICRSRPRI